MKLKFTKTLIFVCIIISSYWSFSQTFDRDAERDKRGNSSSEEVTNAIDIHKKNNFHQLGTNFQILSDIGANLEYTGYATLSKPNEMGNQALYLGTTYGVGYGSISTVNLLTLNVDMTLNYKIPLNDDNLKFLIGAGGGYYSLFALGGIGGSNGDFVFVARSSISYFFAPAIGIFGSATKAGSGDISFSAGLVFRKVR